MNGDRPQFYGLYFYDLRTVCGVILLFSMFLCTVFATNFRVKAAMKNSVLLTWEIRDKTPSQPFTVSYRDFRWCVLIISLSLEILYGMGQGVDYLSIYIETFVFVRGLIISLSL